MQRLIGEVRAGRGPLRFEWMRRNRDGSLGWDEVTLKKVDIAGQPHILAMTREITERKSAVEALRASEEQYRAIFNATADSLVLRDADFRVVDVNPAYEAMSGRRREEALGRSDLTMRRDLVFRRLTQQDDARVQAFVRGLSPRSRHERYFSVIAELPPRELERTTRRSDPRDASLAAFDGAALVALAECAGGEIALVVTDALQGSGLGRELMNCGGVSSNAPTRPSFRSKAS